jgi:hypothetical protein
MSTGIGPATARSGIIDGLNGAAVGIPFGIVRWRELWTHFARDINAVPEQTTPALALALALMLVDIGSIFVEVIAAIRPTTPPGLVLRLE